MKDLIYIFYELTKYPNHRNTEPIKPTYYSIVIFLFELQIKFTELSLRRELKLFENIFERKDREKMYYNDDYYSKNVIM